MPYTNVPASLTGKMDRCVQRVMRQGKSKSAAVAICHRSVVGGGIREAAKRKKGGK